MSALYSPFSYSLPEDPVDSNGRSFHAPIEHAMSLTDRFPVSPFDSPGMYSSRMLTFYSRHQSFGNPVNQPMYIG